jgi:hypothetical protein
VRRLELPHRLKQEFATVEEFWNSRAETRRVDALILSWTKYEKQLRRLFCFLIYQHPRIGSNNIQAVIEIVAEKRDLYPQTFIDGIAKLGVTTVPELLGGRYVELAGEIDRIRKYRNKLIHGQITGQNITSWQLERDVLWIVDWVSALADAAVKQFGYDGLQRKTYRSAKSTAGIVVSQYPFDSPAELKKWLSSLSSQVK